MSLEGDDVQDKSWATQSAAPSVKGIPCAKTMEGCPNAGELKGFKEPTLLVVLLLLSVPL